MGAQPSTIVPANRLGQLLAEARLRNGADLAELAYRSDGRFTVGELSDLEAGHRLLDERLIACANFVGPVKSRYRWQGAIEEGEETLLVMKTRRDQLTQLKARLTEVHPYDVPELLELPVSGGLEAYLQWVRESTGP